MILPFGVHMRGLGPLPIMPLKCVSCVAVELLLVAGLTVQVFVEELVQQPSRNAYAIRFGPQTGLVPTPSLITAPVPSALIARSFIVEGCLGFAGWMLATHATFELSGDQVTLPKPRPSPDVVLARTVDVPVGVTMTTPPEAHATADEFGAQVGSPH